ncbi:hypothetical protein B0H14DRAFT_3169739 [Mycena olivaceomarginata]|nr:hypothetical protein B0H14DRAFT_3169739 [Mycena olivaceomarginata]
MRMGARRRRIMSRIPGSRVQPARGVLVTGTAAIVVAANTRDYSTSRNNCNSSGASVRTNTSSTTSGKTAHVSNMLAALDPGPREQAGACMLQLDVKRFELSDEHDERLAPLPTISGPFSLGNITGKPKVRATGIRGQGCRPPPYSPGGERAGFAGGMRMGARGASANGEWERAESEWEQERERVCSGEPERERRIEVRPQQGRRGRVWGGGGRDRVGGLWGDDFAAVECDIRICGVLLRLCCGMWPYRGPYELGVGVAAVLVEAEEEAGARQPTPGRRTQKSAIPRDNRDKVLCEEEGKEDHPKEAKLTGSGCIYPLFVIYGTCRSANKEHTEHISTYMLHTPRDRIRRLRSINMQHNLRIQQPYSPFVYDAYPRHQDGVQRQPYRECDERRDDDPQEQDHVRNLHAPQQATLDDQEPQSVDGAPGEVARPGELDSGGVGRVEEGGRRRRAERCRKREEGVLDVGEPGYPILGGINWLECGGYPYGNAVGNGSGPPFLVNNTGHNTGCPNTQKVLYMGVAADCEYTQKYGSHSNATSQILINWNTASSLYKSTFNVSLGIVELQIQDEVCPTPVNATTLWNTDCSTVTLNDRLLLFSVRRGAKRSDGVGLWHLMSGCPTGSEVGTVPTDSIWERAVGGFWNGCFHGGAYRVTSRRANSSRTRCVTQTAAHAAQRSADEFVFTYIWVTRQELRFGRAG